MYYITETNLFGEHEVIYTDPVTEKEIRTVVDDFAQGVINARIAVLLNTTVELAKRYEAYYADLLKFADIKGKTKNLIRESRNTLNMQIFHMRQLTTLGEISAHIYENIIPFLATCTIKSNKYFDMLHIIENQVLKYSDKHQLLSENPEFVNS